MAAIAAKPETLEAAIGVSLTVFLGAIDEVDEVERVLRRCCLFGCFLCALCLGKARGGYRENPSWTMSNNCRAAWNT